MSSGVGTLARIYTYPYLHPATRVSTATMRTISTRNATVIIGQKSAIKHIRGWDPSGQSDRADNVTWFREVATMLICSRSAPGCVPDVYRFQPGTIEMEAADCDLGHWIRHRWNPQEIPALTYSMVRAVALCHSAGIVHCDVKPSNMLVFKDPLRIKLADFGFAVPACAGNVIYPIHTQCYRAPEVALVEVVGSPPATLQSPEYLIHGRMTGLWYSAEGRATTCTVPVGYHSDLWPLGLSVLELVTKHRPADTDMSDASDPDEIRQRRHLVAFLEFIGEQDLPDDYWSLISRVRDAKNKIQVVVADMVSLAISPSADSIALSRPPENLLAYPSCEVIPESFRGEVADFISGALRLSRPSLPDLAEAAIRLTVPQPRKVIRRRQRVQVCGKKIKVPREAATTYLKTNSPALVAALFADIEMAYTGQQIPLRDPTEEMAAFDPALCGF